jgi:hypothetical protein
MRYPWPCAGCGGDVLKRAIGRTAYACSDACRAAAWRDRRAGRAGAVLEAAQAARRAARERAGPRITPGERAVIEKAWHLAIAGSYAGHGSPGPEVLNAIRQATAAGAWPEDEVYARIVIEAVLAERTKREDARRWRLAP